MCMMCDWDEELETPDAPEVAEVRRKAAQESWAKLMEELARVDNPDSARAKGADGV